MAPYVGEIRIFAGNFAPAGWAMCDGQFFPISENDTLFNLIGTTYGGDGRSTFALPDLQGNAPMHHGQGPGLSLRDLGEMSGSETITLLDSEMPLHTHPIQAYPTDPADVQAPSPAVSLARSSGGNAYLASPADLVAIAPPGHWSKRR